VGSPNPLTNGEYTKALGKVLNRPTVFPLPAQAARLMLGEVADELLLASVRVEPAKLKETGYGFRYPELEGALRHLLGR
jgi:NAD dependent epimerase/dehydratase family enzyme